MNEADKSVAHLPRKFKFTELELTRFWGKVKKGGLSDCWLWSASVLRGGYGNFILRGKTRQAHRIAWMIKHGPIPDGICVLHKCDNPPCVNPLHLFLGTKKDNVADMFTKGRQAGLIGEACGSSKLTDKEVEAIRRQYKKGIISYGTLGKQYGVTAQNVYQIMSRKTWRHLE